MDFKVDVIVGREVQVVLVSFFVLCPLLWSPRFLFTDKNLDLKIGNGRGYTNLEN